MIVPGQEVYARIYAGVERCTILHRYPRPVDPNDPEWVMRAHSDNTTRYVNESRLVPVPGIVLLAECAA